MGRPADFVEAKLAALPYTPLTAVLKVPTPDEVWGCPKCDNSSYDLQYSEPNNNLTLSCQRCGYSETRLPLDAAAKDPTSW